MANFEILQQKVSPKFTKDVVLNMLKKDCGCDEVTVNDINYGAEFKKGDSYLSTVTRFSIDYEYNDGTLHSKTLNVIAKALLRNVARRKTFRSAEFFANEIAFYKKVWPALDAFQKSKNPTEPFIEIPKCLALYADGENDYVALEDVSFFGYRGAEKSAGLDSNHVQLVVKVFARFHALSMAYKQENPDGFKKIDNWLQETYFADVHRTWYEAFQNVLKDVVRDAVSQELPEKYLQKLNELFSVDLYGQVIEDCAQRGPLSVVTHGDAWIPNFLMKYDETHKPLKAIMIDFQLTRVSSLALDLHFFLYSCGDRKFLENDYHNTLDFYCKNFVSFLEDLGAKTNLFTKEMLMKDMRRSGAFAVAMCMEAIIMSLLEDDEVSDLDQIQGDQAVPIETVWIVEPLKTKEKRQRVAYFVKHAVDNEYI